MITLQIRFLEYTEIFNAPTSVNRNQSDGLPGFQVVIARTPDTHPADDEAISYVEIVEIPNFGVCGIYVTNGGRQASEKTVAAISALGWQAAYANTSRNMRE